MNVERITLDTNILIYAIDNEAGQRHKLAIKVIERALTSADCSLTLQSLSEFFNAVTRKNKLSPKIAMEHVHDLIELFPVITAKQTTLKHAMKTVCEHKLSFWDAMLLATVQDAGISILLSEDFQHEQSLGRVRIINPFIPNHFWSMN